MTESILEEAQRLIHGQRNKDYGHPRDNINHTARLWSAYLGVEIDALDVSVMMILLKASRMKTTGQYHRDSVVDIAGYAGVAERVYEEPVEDPGVVTPNDARQHLGIPRQWDRLVDVPLGVKFEDVEGDRRYKFDGVHWTWDVHVLKDPADWEFGPFTEVVE